MRIDQITIAHDGQHAAFLTSSVSQRQEKVEDVELFVLGLNQEGSSRDTGGTAKPIPLTHNTAVETNLEWAPDNRHLFFQVNLGSLERNYEDPQPRLYWVDAGALVRSVPKTGGAVVTLSFVSGGVSALKVDDSGVYGLGLTCELMKLVGGGAMAEHADVLLAVPLSVTPRIQEAQAVTYHIICESVEAALCTQP